MEKLSVLNSTRLGIEKWLMGINDVRSFFFFLTYSRRAQLSWIMVCLYGWAGKESACSVGDLGSIPGLGRSPGGGKGYPLQYFGLENSMDCVVHEVAKSQTQLSKFLFHFCHRKPNSKRETYFNSLCCDWNMDIIVEAFQLSSSEQQ